MKKSVILLLVLMAAMTVKAQTVGEITDSVKAGLKAGSIKDAVNTIKGAFEKKSAEASQIVGTWTFVESAVMVTSGRLLAKAAGNLVDDKLKDLLDDYFERSNVTPQNTSITFHKDGTFSRSVAGRKRHGVWIVGGEKLILGVDNVQTAAMTTHMENDTLTLVVETSRIMEALQALGALSDTKTHNALIKLSKNLKGVEAGFLLARRKNLLR